jgi:hypothetical protein
MNWRFKQELIDLRLGARTLRFLLGPLLAALAFQLRFLTKLDLALAFLEGLTGFSDDAPRSDEMCGKPARDTTERRRVEFPFSRACRLDSR